MKKSEITKDKILESAIEIFAQKGFSATSTFEIANRAKVAEGTIFRYYPKKTDLLYEIVLKIVKIYAQKKAIESLKEVIKKNIDNEIDIFLKAIIVDRLSFIKENLNLLKIVLYEMNFHQDIKDVLKETLNKNILEILEIIVPIIKNKINVKDIDDIQIFKLFISFIVGFVIQSILFKTIDLDADDLEDDLDLAIEIFIKGIRRD